MNKKTSLSQVYKTTQEIYHLKSLAGLASWDQEVLMPNQSGKARAEMLATLEGLIHQKYTDPFFYDLVCSSIENEKSINIQEFKLLNELKKDLDKSKKIPQELATQIAFQNSTTQQIWAKVRQNQLPLNDYLQSLHKSIELKKQEADCIKNPNQCRYEALLNSFEPDFSLNEVSLILNKLKDTIQSIPLKPIQSVQIPELNPKQKEIFIGELLNQMGFDLNQGRLDQSEHPFSMGLHPTDVRITQRLQSAHPLEFIYTNLHEAGHALYEQGLPIQWEFTPLCEARSLSVHESQSRLWENLVGRSHPFFEWMSRFYFDQFKLDCKPSDLYLAANQIKKSYIRVDADEVTYNLHVILRFTIEDLIFNHGLQTQDIEAVWNQLYFEFFDQKIDHVKNGFLQDVHWSCGLFGYFPTYSLGNVLSAQIFNSFTKEYPQWDSLCAQGDWTSLKSWLNKNIHQHGRMFTAQELLKQIGHDGISTIPFQEYLQSKFMQ